VILRKLSSNHDMLFGHGLRDFIKDSEAVMQNVKTRIYLLKGEWFLDTDAGVPWLQEIMVKPEKLQLLESLIKAEVLETFGVKEITEFSLVFNRNTRIVTVSIISSFNDELTVVA
jgi:hypothetical protein